MRATPQLRRHVALAMAVLLFVLTGPVDAARAALVTTEQAITGAAAVSDRERVVAFLARDDVRAQMVALGVDPAEAARRVGGLSDAEVQRIAGHLDQLPAGQSALAALLGAVLFIFLVLLITDLLGLTDVFPFVRR
jgi:Family of unknown function (DUF6627)